jgi:hypothetical protein
VEDMHRPLGKLYREESWRFTGEVISVKSRMESLYRAWHRVGKYPKVRAGKAD